VTQLFSFLADYGDTLETAFHRPRIDASEGALVIGDTALDEEIHRALQARFDYVQQHRLTLPFKYACPSGVLTRGNTNWGATEISSPWADAVGE
jgi:gamma-glutamyltranspeptidase/glutathione hydrolase